jgi:excisionase family DNA binding protein
MPVPSTNPTRLASLDQTARYLGVSTRTVRHYLGHGYFTGYRTPGTRGLLFDLDEVDAAMLRLPARKARAAHGSYGPKAVIRDLPRRPVVVMPQGSE